MAGVGAMAGDGDPAAGGADEDEAVASKMSRLSKKKRIFHNLQIKLYSFFYWGVQHMLL